MYSRPSSRDFRVPSNYGGNAFRDNTPTQAQDLTRRQTQYRREEQQQTPTEISAEDFVSAEAINDTYSAEHRESECCEHSGKCEHCNERKEKNFDIAAEKKDSGNSLFSSIGALGSEEILLIALALIIFQSGKEPELALILLALLFIN